MSSRNERAYWEAHAKHYDRSMSLLGGPIPRMAELCAEAVRGAAQVLEVAAGTGLVTSALARSAKEIVATDYASEMVGRVEDRIQQEGLTNVRCEQADLYALRFEPGSFDAVVAANVLHLVPDLPRALAAIRRVLRPGGRLIVPTYCHDETALAWVVSRALSITGFPGHRRFSVRSLQGSLKSAGLNIQHVETRPVLYRSAMWWGASMPRHRERHLAILPSRPERQVDQPSSFRP